jgi:hypothetical protein
MVDGQGAPGQQYFGPRKYWVAELLPPYNRGVIGPANQIRSSPLLARPTSASPLPDDRLRIGVDPLPSWTGV